MNDVLADIESGQRLEREGFAQWAQGRVPSGQDIENNADNRDWYLNAQEALDHKLVGAVV